MRKGLGSRTAAGLIGVALLGVGVVGSAGAAASAFCKDSAVVVGVGSQGSLSTSYAPTQSTSLAVMNKDLTFVQSVHQDLVVMVSGTSGTQRSTLRNALGDSAIVVADVQLAIKGREELATKKYPVGGSKITAEATLRAGVQGSNDEIIAMMITVSKVATPIDARCPNVPRGQ